MQQVIPEEQRISDGRAPAAPSAQPDAQAAGERRFDWPWLLSTAALGAVMVFFAWVHFSHWRSTGRPVGLGLMLQELVMAVLFVARRRPRGTSRSVVAWLATGLGTFGMLAAWPAYHPVLGLGPLYIMLQLIGTSAAIISLTRLGRSFGLVAANRGVQTRGPYGLVRHPIYASYMITYLAYLLESPSLRNAMVVIVVVTFQLVRIAKEEAFLSMDASYRAYQKRVRYRLLPFLY